VKEVALEKMADGARKIHAFKPDFEEFIVKCGVSCDGTWQRHWERVTIGDFVDAEVLPLGIYDEAAHFNIGSQDFIKIFDKHRISPGEFRIIDE